MLKKEQPLKFESGFYSTGEKKVSIFAKLFPGLVFYSTVIRSVLGSSRAAKRGELTADLYYQASLMNLRGIEHVGGRIEISNYDAFSKEGWPYVFVSNHMSVLETFVLASLVHEKGPHVFIIKKELTVYPVFKHTMNALNPIIVGRDNPREDLVTVLTEGEKRLKAGMSVIVFPQRTRAILFDPAQFNSIGIKLAKRAGVPVVPMVLKTDFWGQGKKHKDFGKINPQKTVYFSFGSPIHIRGRGQQEHEKVVNFITGKLKEWNSPVL